MAGKDLGYHPEDDPKMSKMSIAPPPSAEEFLINKTNEEVFIYLFLLFYFLFHEIGNVFVLDSLNPDPLCWILIIPILCVGFS